MVLFFGKWMDIQLLQYSSNYYELLGKICVACTRFWVLLEETGGNFSAFLKYSSSYYVLLLTMENLHLLLSFSEWMDISQLCYNLQVTMSC